LITGSPVFGRGPETFGGEFRRIESEELARAYPDYYHESPHNYFLDVAVSQGVFGLLVAVLLLATGVVAGLQYRGDHSVLISGLLSGLIAMVTALQFDPLTLPNAVLLYSLIAFLVGAGTTFSRQPQRRRSHIPGSSIALLALAVASLAVMYTWKD